MPNFKLGKLPPQRRMSTPAFGDFLDKATTWPTVEAKGWEYAVPLNMLDIMGNDVWGCCAEAAAMHYIQTWSYNVGQPINPTTAETLTLYAALTGFDPNAGPSGNNPTDQGTVLIDLLTYWKNTGITVGGQIHKIAGFASLDTTSVAQMRYGTYLFGGNYLGINLPEACQENTTNWNFAPGLKIEGGHCIDRFGQGAAGGNLSSWGMDIPSSNEFILGYSDEGYVIWGQDWIEKNSGKSPSGLAFEALVTAGAAI